jgi:hypothetical protein
LPWHRGVECKHRKRNIAPKKLSAPEQGVLDAAGSSSWLGAEIVCHHRRGSEFCGVKELKVFEARGPISGSIVREEFANGITAVRKPTAG